MPSSGFVTLLLLLSLAAVAHGDEPALTSQPCAAVAVPSERLVCYDRTFPPMVDGAALADKVRAEFGLSRSEVNARNPALAPPVEPDRIEATVARVMDRGNGQRLITLDNGQVWMQMAVTSLGSLKEGDRIAVRQAALSSYQLVTPGGVPLRVRRVK